MEARRNRPGPRPVRRAWHGAPAIIFAVLALVACGAEDVPPPTPSPTPTPVATVAATPTPEPAVLLDEAYVLLRSGRHAEAADAFAAIAERATDPRERSTARLGEAVAAYEMGSHGRSLSLLRQAFATAAHGSPEEARAVYLLGVRLNEAGAFEEAVALLRPHAVLGSGLALAPAIVSEYARALAGNGDVERAETVWQSLLATPGLGEQLRLPILRQRAVKVTRFDDRLAKLAADMVETMEAERGVGLAANQVGALQRMCVVKPEDWEEPLILVNPEIIRREGQREVEEGCLSHAGYRAMVKRSKWIRFGALDHTKKVVKMKADDLLAQAMEHEVDHLNGILYLDHLVEHSKPYRVDENGEPLDQEHETDEDGPAASSELLVPEDVPASLKIR